MALKRTRRKGTIMTHEEEIQKLKTTISKQRKSRKEVNKELANEKLRYSKLEERFNKLSQRPRTPLRKQLENVERNYSQALASGREIKREYDDFVKENQRRVGYWQEMTKVLTKEVESLKEELRKSKQNNRETMVEILEAQLPAGFHNILNRLLNPEDYQ